MQAYLGDYLYWTLTFTIGAIGLSYLVDGIDKAIGRITLKGW